MNRTGSLKIAETTLRAILRRIRPIPPTPPVNYSERRLKASERILLGGRTRRSIAHACVMQAVPTSTRRVDVDSTWATLRDTSRHVVTRHVTSRATHTTRHVTSRATSRSGWPDNRARRSTRYPLVAHMNFNQLLRSWLHPDGSSRELLNDPRYVTPRAAHTTRHVTSRAAPRGRGRGGEGQFGPSYKTVLNPGHDGYPTGGAHEPGHGHPEDLQNFLSFLVCVAYQHPPKGRNGRVAGESKGVVDTPLAPAVNTANFRLLGSIHWLSGGYNGTTV